MKNFKSILVIMVALSVQLLVQSLHAQQLDHPALRGFNDSKLLYQDQTSAYYYIDWNGSEFIAAFHNVSQDEDLIEHTKIDVPKNWGSSRHLRMAFKISKSEEDYFNNYLVEPFLELSPSSVRTTVFHYNANVLLGKTQHFPYPEGENENYEEPLMISIYLKKSPWFAGVRQYGWELDHGPNRRGVADFTSVSNTQYSFSVKDALAYREIKTTDFQAAQRESIAMQAQQIRDASAERTRLINREMARRKPGVVYKSDHFWDPIPYHETIRHVFEGEFTNIKNRYDFMKAFNGYVTMYSGRCNAYLPENRVNRNWASQSVTRDIAGREKYRGDEKQHVMEMDPRFSPYYDTYLKALESHQVAGAYGMAIDMMIAVSKPGADPFSTVGKKVTEAIEQDSFYQLAFFFSDTKCASATTKQLNENMYRAAAELPSIQQAGIRHANAEAESDSAEKFLFEKTFRQACAQYFISRGNNDSAARYCPCADKVTRSTLTQQERTKYTENFRVFFQEVGGAHVVSDDPRGRGLDKCSN